MEVKTFCVCNGYYRMARPLLKGYKRLNYKLMLIIFSPKILIKQFQIVCSLPTVALLPDVFFKPLTNHHLSTN